VNYIIQVVKGELKVKICAEDLIKEIESFCVVDENVKDAIREIVNR
jgi:hypothetical protein